MKILVTGGAGFIGSHTIKRLLELKYEVICLDNFDSYYSPSIKRQNILEFLSNKNFKLYKIDIRNLKKLDKIFKSERPDKICHLAARVGVRESINNPAPYFETNVQGTLNLLKLAADYKAKNFIFASSSTVYGNNKKTPFKENDTTDNQLSPYAITKKSAELLISNYNKLYHLPSTILRFFSVYGPAGRPDMSPYLFTDAIYKSKPIVLFGDGMNKRDFTFIDDVVDGIIAALSKNYSFEIFNIGNGHTVSLKDLIIVIESILSKKSVICNSHKQLGDMPVTLADISKAKKMLNYNPKLSIKRGMERFIRWYLNQHRER